VVLAGLVLAVLVVAGILFFTHRPGPKPAKAPALPAPEKDAREAPQPGDVSAQELWRRAEAAAADGQFLEGVRLLHLAVLFLLDRRRLLRYERTRTNGEYVRQVRLAENAPADLHVPFERLTTLFETKFYGDRSCDGGEYAACRGLAEEVRDLAGAA
jgi:hypothetical protein